MCIRIPVTGYTLLRCSFKHNQYLTCGWSMSTVHGFILIFLVLHSHHGTKAHCYSKQLIGKKCPKERFNSREDCTFESVDSPWRNINQLCFLSAYITTVAGLQFHLNIHWMKFTFDLVLWYLLFVGWYSVLADWVNKQLTHNKY